MNNKMLIGSIIAVAVLIGVSFTSVVGYRSVDSDVKVSPLFNIRSSRAIEEESEELSCEYVGKGDAINLLIPKRDDKTVLIQKVIDVISNMDEETSNRFVNFLINHHSKMIKDENIPVIINELHQVMINPDEIKIYIINENDKELYTEEGFCETVGFIWVPGCLIALIIGNLIWLILSIITIILDCLNYYNTWLIGDCTIWETCRNCPPFTLKKIN